MEHMTSFNEFEKSNYITGLNKLKSKILDTCNKLNDEKIVSRIWNQDYTVWKNDPTEISNRLGWLQSPEIMGETLYDIELFVDQVRAEGFTHALLLGMGGSSLAPEVFRRSFGVKEGFLDLAVIDTTNPDAILEKEKSIDITKTLFIVSTKSGGTVETVSLMKYFYNRVLEIVGNGNVGKHFIAITDPGSGLESIAKSLDFRKIFLNDPNIGGRYSALSFFGILPAALIGVDIHKILDTTNKMVEYCKVSDAEKNPGVWLGVILGLLTQSNVDKLTFIISDKIKYFGLWLEQLIAESTGKEGNGILPIDDEELLSPEFYSNDRLFVLICVNNDYSDKLKIEKVREKFPIIEFNISDIYQLGSEFFRWEFATIIASKILNINPFDQPNVESAKVLARQMVSDYHEKGVLPEINYNYSSKSLKLLAQSKFGSIEKILEEFFSKINIVENQMNKNAYVAIQAYLIPSQEVAQFLQRIRTKIQKKWKRATTIGYGPRFLHSTGQLHKGDSGNGLFIQIIGKSSKDINIPDDTGKSISSISFGTLFLSQAFGDRQALVNESRNVILFDIGNDLKNGLSEILNNI